MTSGRPATFVLEFSFPADIKVPLPVQEIAATYLQVLGETTVKPDIVKGMLPLWLHGHLNGDPRLTEAALAPLRSPDIAFSWPWFDEWRDRFRRAGILPRVWDDFSAMVDDGRRGLRDQRVGLLNQTIAARIYNRHRAGQHLALLSGLSPAAAQLRHFTLRTDCEASEVVSREKLASVDPRDWLTYPPYFPGDSTDVSLLRSRPGQ